MQQLNNNMKKDCKTIGLTVRFFTTDLPDKIGKDPELTPCWSNGLVYIEANKEKGIKCFQKHFYNLDEIEDTIKLVLKKSKIGIFNN